MLVEMPWRRVLSAAAGAVDRAVVVALHARGARDRAQAESMSHDERMVALEAIHRSYADGHRDFFAPAAAIDPTLREVRAGVWDASWPSTFTPYLPDVADKYLARVENRTARARLFLGAASGRPALIAVHGYLGGHWVMEEAAWPIAWLRRLGLDVALPVLPFHGLRAGARRGAPPFPSADPRMTNEGFRQAAADILALARLLRDRGAPKVGVIGMSLGGYTSALLATVADTLDFVVPIIPLASVADFARDQGRLGDGDESDAQHAALESANWIVSPLARPLAIPRERALVVAAENDQITPTSHARRIASHFDCELVTVPGGHLVQLGRREGFGAIARMLAREGIIAERRARR
jgi:predicted alpha/beta hydrolase family esterase